MSENNMKHRSSVYDSMVKSPNRAMLRATGMTDDSFEKPIVGVISTWAENTPCNIHLHGFGQIAKEGVKDAGAWPVQFGTITVADGIAMGTPGMRFSLTSRDIIADSIDLIFIIGIKVIFLPRIAKQTRRFLSIYIGVKQVQT